MRRGEVPGGHSRFSPGNDDGVKMRNEEKFKEIRDPVSVSDEVEMSAVKIQDLQARRCVIKLPRFVGY